MSSEPIDKRLARRDFLQAMTAAGLATVVGAAPRLRAADKVEHPAATADTCILLWMAGGMAAPDLGSWIGRVRGPKNPAIPAFINIGQRLEGVGESEELKAFTTGGFFGSEYGPFNIPYPQEAAASL